MSASLPDSREMEIKKERRKEKEQDENEARGKTEAYRASESQECTASIQPITQRHQYLRPRAQGLGQSALKSKLI